MVIKERWRRKPLKYSIWLKLLLCKLALCTINIVLLYNIVFYYRKYSSTKPPIVIDLSAQTVEQMESY